MLSADLESEVREEIEALHAFFVDWFSGAVPETDEIFETGFLRRFGRGFCLIPPAGTMLELSELASSIRASHGSNPRFRIAIRNVAIRREFDDHVLATYEEWQRNALASTPPDNARVASVIFQSGNGLKWLHVHETWLPEAIMDVGPYDF